MSARGLVLVILTALTSAAASPVAAGPLRAGAAGAVFSVPAGTPLAGYGGLRRRLLVPDILDRHPHAFWFKPHAGQLDPLAARALVLEVGSDRVTWVTLDVIAVDRAFTRDVERSLAEQGLGGGTLILSASHTHSGPGAFIDSGLMGWVAVDRFDPEVRRGLVETVTAAVRRAHAGKVEARVAVASVTAPALTKSRLGRSLDGELVVLKVTTATAAPIALVWNFAIHGTVLGPRNLRLSGDVMGVASGRLERGLGVPVLFVNGAVGDVSPRDHGDAGLGRLAGELAATAREAWTRAAPVTDTTLTVRRQRVVLPRPWLSVRNCVGRWVPALVSVPLGWALPADAELVAVGLGDAAWLVIPGELQTALGVEIKREARTLFAHAFVAGVSNDYLGYFVTSADYGRPTYVTCATLYGPRAGECLAATASDLLHRLRGRERAVGSDSGACGPTPSAR